MSTPSSDFAANFAVAARAQISAVLAEIEEIDKKREKLIAEAGRLRAAIHALAGPDPKPRPIAKVMHDDSLAKITEALRACGGNIRNASKVAGLKYSTMKNRIADNPGIWPDGVPRRHHIVTCQMGSRTYAVLRFAMDTESFTVRTVPAGIPIVDVNNAFAAGYLSVTRHDRPRLNEYRISDRGRAWVLARENSVQIEPRDNPPGE